MMTILYKRVTQSTSVISCAILRKNLDDTRQYCSENQVLYPTPEPERHRCPPAGKRIPNQRNINRIPPKTTPYASHEHARRHAASAGWGTGADGLSMTIILLHSVTCLQSMGMGLASRGPVGLGMVMRPDEGVQRSLPLRVRQRGDSSRLHVWLEAAAAARA